MRRLLMIAALFLAAANTGIEVMGLHAVGYVTKPLATLALAVIVLRTGAASPYRTWIGTGLVASLAGDILLMLPQGRFVAGLVAFLIAHLCYIRAFASDGVGRSASWWTALPVYGAAVLILATMWPSLDVMRLPVVCYVAVISTMSWQAIARWQVRRTSLAAFAAVGSLFFLASDSALAMRRFVAPFAGATFIILATYYAAQFGMALSVPNEESIG